MNYKEVETAIELDSDVLQDEEYLEQQRIVKTHYSKAAELDVQGYTERAERHEEAAYEAALELREMVIHELDRGAAWGRVYRSLDGEASE